MEGRCEEHLFDRAVDLCGRCGGEYCQDCVVYPFGPAKLPYCRPCAIEAAGVRSNAGNRQIDRRERQQLFARREALFARLT